ncbi:MAG: M24 family metallopeptidase [Candidatus Limnocylindria bacterium]
MPLTMARPDPFAPERPARVAAVRSIVGALELDGILVQSRATSRYLSGFSLRRGDESTSGYSGTLLVTTDESLILADNRYVEQAAAEAPGWELVSTADPLPVTLPPLLQRAGIRRLGLEADRTSFAGWNALAAAAGSTELVAVESELAELRVVKSPAEVDAIERACGLGDRAFDFLVSTVRPGMTERAVARLITEYLEDQGAEDLAFDSIVLVGARASMPHGSPNDTSVQAGKALLMDFGCQVDGYRSDMTRTVFVGDPDPLARHRHELVAAAQRAALETVRVGAPASAPHQAAQAFLADAGYPEAFRHGIGHGIGLETHEPPKLKDSDAPLRAGMVFSIEPGLYLPGEIGVRIEDIVVLEAEGPRLLTASPRHAVVIGERQAA